MQIILLDLFDEQNLHNWSKNIKNIISCERFAVMFSVQVHCVWAGIRQQAVCSESNWQWYYPLPAQWSPAVTWRLWSCSCPSFTTWLYIYTFTLHIEVTANSVVSNIYL